MSDIKKLDLTDERREILTLALSDAANVHDQWTRKIHDHTLAQLEETTADRIMLTAAQQCIVVSAVGQYMTLYGDASGVAHSIIDQLTMTRKEYAATMNRL